MLTGNRPSSSVAPAGSGPPARRRRRSRTRRGASPRRRPRCPGPVTTSISSGPMPAISKALRAADDRRRVAALIAQRRTEHLEGPVRARRQHGRTQVDRPGGELAGDVGRGEHERHGALGRRAEHVLRQRVGDHRRFEDLILRQGRAPPGVRVLGTVAERLRRDLGQHLPARCRARACSAGSSSRRTASSASTRSGRTSPRSRTAPAPDRRRPAGACRSRPPPRRRPRRRGSRCTR